MAGGGGPEEEGRRLGEGGRSGARLRSMALITFSLRLFKGPQLPPLLQHEQVISNLQRSCTCPSKPATYISIGNLRKNESRTDLERSTLKPNLLPIYIKINTSGPRFGCCPPTLYSISIGPLLSSCHPNLAPVLLPVRPLLACLLAAASCCRCRFHDCATT